MFNDLIVATLAAKCNWPLKLRLVSEQFCDVFDQYYRHDTSKRRRVIVRKRIVTQLSDIDGGDDPETHGCYALPPAPLRRWTTFNVLATMTPQQFREYLPFDVFPYAMTAFTAYVASTIDENYIRSLRGVGRLELRTVALVPNFRAEQFCRVLDETFGGAPPSGVTPPPLRHVSILNCYALISVSAFRNVHTICLCYCQNLSDVSPLANVRDVTIENCMQIVDVSPLRHAKRLSLADCPNIEDVSALGNVQRLNLSRTNIRSVAALSHVSMLNLTECNRITTHLPLTNVKQLFVGRYMHSFENPRAASNYMLEIEVLRRVYCVRVNTEESYRFVSPTMRDYVRNGILI